MNINKVIVVISVFLIFVLVIAFIICKNRIAEKNVQEQPISDNYLLDEEESKTKDLIISEYTNFTVYDADGKEYNLSEYANNPIAILFFNDKEEDSITVLDKFESMYPIYKEKIKFLIIDVTQEANSELESKYEMKILYDFYKQATRNYNITQYPAMIYIGHSEEKKGYTIINSKIGVPSSDALEANLDIISGNY